MCAPELFHFLRFWLSILNMLDLVYENLTEDLNWPESFFSHVLSMAADHLNLKDKQIEIGLHLVTPERSQELNSKYRNKNKPTDVLSFPMEEHSLESYGILPVGDIFVCLEVAKAQAKEMDLPVNEEMTRLVVHGFLHLLGYDHERSPEEEEKMIALQETIVQKALNS